METKLSELRMEFLLDGCDKITKLGKTILGKAGASLSTDSVNSRTNNNQITGTDKPTYLAFDILEKKVKWYPEQTEILPPQIICRLGIIATNYEIFQHAVGIIQLIVLNRKKEEKVLATYRYLPTIPGGQTGYIIYSPENHEKFWTESESFFKMVYGELVPTALAVINQ